MLGQLGTVSGTALDQVLVRRLQDGDPGGHMQEALSHFPFPALAEQILRKFYIAGGKSPSKPYLLSPMQGKDGPREFRELCVAGNFCEVWLARQGHDNPVGINFMEKLQPPHLPSIYGAMLGGVSFILMGAGIPMKIPGILDRYAAGEPATYPLTVTGATPGSDETLMRFDPRDYFPEPLPQLRRPMFLAIVASAVLAATLAKKANGRVDGFIIEGPSAGGHNAPPRGPLQLSQSGEPIYGERDVVDLAKFRSLGLPFWLAGNYGSPEGYRSALAEGAAGIQVGTAFAFSEESAMSGNVKRTVIEQVQAGTARVFTDPNASPTGFPFKVAQVPGTVAEEAVFQARPRVCDLGYLREAYLTADGSIDFRCPSEVPAVFAAKGGDIAETAGRKCICNGLLAAIDQPQVRGQYTEPGVVTCGDCLSDIAQFLAPDEKTYKVEDVIRRLLG